MKALALFILAGLAAIGLTYHLSRPVGHKEADANRVRHTLKLVRTQAKTAMAGFKSYFTRVFDTHKPAENMGFGPAA